MPWADVGVVGYGGKGEGVRGNYQLIRTPESPNGSRFVRRDMRLDVTALRILPDHQPWIRTYPSKVRNYPIKRPRYMVPTYGFLTLSI